MPAKRAAPLRLDSYSLHHPCNPSCAHPAFKPYVTSFPRHGRWWRRLWRLLPIPVPTPVPVFSLVASLPHPYPCWGIGLSEEVPGAIAGRLFCLVRVHFRSRTASCALSHPLWGTFGHLCLRCSLFGPASLFCPLDFYVSWVTGVNPPLAARAQVVVVVVMAAPKATVGKALVVVADMAIRYASFAHMHFPP